MSKAWAFRFAIPMAMVGVCVVGAQQKPSQLGFFITSAHQSVRELAGAQVLQIGNAPVAEAVSRARELMADQSPEWAGASKLFESWGVSQLAGRLAERA